MEPIEHAIARMCHEANRGICIAMGDNSQVAWEAAPEWQRESAIKGVQFCIANPDAPPSANHDSWSLEKVTTGWKFGAIKDPVAKTHPCLVPFDDLPAAQKVKDVVFKAIVATMFPQQ